LTLAPQNTNSPADGFLVFQVKNAIDLESIIISRAALAAINEVSINMPAVLRPTRKNLI
jgi:hypothetical protein